MIRAFKIGIASTAAALIATAALSQSMLGLSDRREPSPGADPNRGRFITIGGMFADQRIGCVQCHGIDGSGNSSGAFPRLTDQAGWYLFKTLQDYASGLRPSEIMGPIAQTLSPQQMQDVAAYYASIKEAPYPAELQVDVQTRQIGGAIAAVGIPSQGVPACDGCHGPNGVGQAPLYPYLGGQFAPYLQHQLMLWKQGRRDGDPMNVMELIAKAMTAEQIRAVSLYYASVRPRDVIPRDVRYAPDAGRSPAVQSLQSPMGNSTDVGAVQNPQPGRSSVVVPGTEPAGPPSPTVELPLGLPRRPLPPNALPPYLSPPVDERPRGTTTTTGAPVRNQP
ncbi:c-type cytochrome [Microvirga splendida]|uniref:C-type cytochrome n=1 Tax=Microvirga splendida TaxID=2795727 RepID=A0ABS0Y3Z4_9HYPH|nr:c-type cytochrome [Microvirga splendida]MBJ6127007.1 c-type cytochrome [Microvirga splendida]